jgi:hypothetical protein
MGCLHGDRRGYLAASSRCPSADALPKELEFRKAVPNRMSVNRSGPKPGRVRKFGRLR